MRSRLLRALLPAALFGVLAFALPAAANHTGEERSPNMVHVANVDKEGTNSDLAFWENLAAAGHFQGFRLIDITKPEAPVPLKDFTCNGGQSDVSFYKAKDRLLLFQSVDRAQERNPLNPTDPCQSINSTAADPNSFEGIRIFDVTDPRAPFLVREVYTSCGSHTHTTIPDDENQRAVIYVSSYPLSPVDIGPRCQQPHRKISIVLVPDDNPAAAEVKEHPLHEDTQVFADGIQGCHDITAFTDPKIEIAAAACLSEAQLWDISDPANPTTTGSHTHIDNPFVEIWHSSALTWDGEILLFWDEHGGGMVHGCDTTLEFVGNIWFYDTVKPGTPTAPLFGRYQVPRPEPANQVCDLHNGSVIPVNDNEAYVGVSAVYEGGTTIFEFTGLKVAQPVDLPDPLPDDFVPPIVATEIAYWDNENNSDGRGNDDVWSSYWYNDYIYTNGGIGARQLPLGSNRGFDVYKLRQANLKQKFTARKFNHFNPQTQENFETLGG
jgi:hypothetical protein